MTCDRALEDAVHEIMSDKMPRSAKWIIRELNRRGFDDVTSQKVRSVCKSDPKIEIIGMHSGRAEYKMVG